MMVPQRPEEGPSDGRLSAPGSVAPAHAEAGSVAPAHVDAAAVAASHAHYRLREWPVAVVLIGVAISLVVVVDNHFRRGSVLLALSVLLAAALRLLLPARLAGVLAVRSRLIDVFILGGLGTGLLVLALVVPPPR